MRKGFDQSGYEDRTNSGKARYREQQDAGMGEYTPPTDARETRLKNLEMERTRRVNLFSKQMSDMQKIFTSGTVNSSHDGTEDKDLTKVNEIEGLYTTPSKNINSVTALDNIDMAVPASKMDPNVSGMVHTSNRIYTTPANNAQIVSTTDKISTSDLMQTPISVTPIQKNSSPENSTDGDSSSSVGTIRDKSCTPTLTDLENSIHCDCRLDKVLRVALDYALPEEHA